MACVGWLIWRPGKANQLAALTAFASEAAQAVAMVAAAGVVERAEAIGMVAGVTLISWPRPLERESLKLLYPRRYRSPSGMVSVGVTRQRV